MPESGRVADGDTLRLVEAAERLRYLEVTLLGARGALRGVDTDLVATSAVAVSADEIVQVKEAVGELAEHLEWLTALVDDLEAADVEVRLAPLQTEAEAALSDGVMDIERLRILAECLDVRSGLQALAAMLRTTDCHTAWGEATVGDVLAWFRRSDVAFARRLVDLAHTSPAMRWADLDDGTIDRLATVFEEHASTERCR